MEKMGLPTKKGQICSTAIPLPGDDPAETYIIIEDVHTMDDDAITLVVSITDLQRNIGNPALAPRKPVRKSDLIVVANDLQSYVESWNVKS